MTESNEELQSSRTDSSFLSPLLQMFPAFPSRKRGSDTTFHRGNYKKTQGNGRPAGAPVPSSNHRGSLRDQCWNQDGTGPLMETKRFAGTSLDFPKVAPLRAKTEDKKLILAQTARRLENASESSATWASKTDFIVNRFLGTVPHASNEADINLVKFDSFSSNLFEYGAPMGLTSDYAQTDVRVGWRSPSWFLQLEMRIHPKQMIPDHMEVNGLPDMQTLEILIRLPKNDRQDGLHPDLTVENLSDPKILFRLFEATDTRIEVGMLNSYTRRFDPSLFQKELTKLKHESKFFFVKAVLLRDYVGQGLLPDLENRLQACRQVTYINGRMRIKPISEHHADFMRLVQELNTEEDVPLNLTSILFHNLSQELKTELLNQGYSTPPNTNALSQQYKNLSVLNQKAAEAERRIRQVSTLIRNTIGSHNRPTMNTSAFSASYQNREDDEEQEDPYMGSYPSQDHDVEDDDEPGEIQVEAMLCRHFLSVAENALREASGEPVPLKCWGCGDIPAYEKNCFHRFGSCPYKADARVQANFKINVEKWQEGRRQKRMQQSKYGPSTSYDSKSNNRVNHVTFASDVQGGQPDDDMSPEAKVFKSAIQPLKPDLTKPPPCSDTDLCQMIGLKTAQDKTSGDTVFRTYVTSVTTVPTATKIMNNSAFTTPPIKFPRPSNASLPWHGKTPKHTPSMLDTPFSYRPDRTAASHFPPMLYPLQDPTKLHQEDYSPAWFAVSEADGQESAISLNSWLAEFMTSCVENDPDFANGSYSLALLTTSKEREDSWHFLSDFVKESDTSRHFAWLPKVMHKPVDMKETLEDNSERKKQKPPYHKIPEYFYPAKEPFQKDRYEWGYSGCSYENERKRRLSDKRKWASRARLHSMEDPKWLIQANKKNTLMNEVRQNYGRTKEGGNDNRTTA